MRRALLLVGLVACGDRPDAPSTATGSATTAAVGSGSAMTCIADQVEPHDRVWVRRTDCTVDNAACRDDCMTKNDASACMSRATTLERDPAQREEANAMFIRACELGTTAGCTNYAGFLWANNKANAASACALALFEKTCSARDPFGCGMLGRMRVDTAATPDDLAKGRATLEGSCDALGGFPCRVLALELESTKLGAFDPAQIGVLLARACGGGDQAACGTHATAAETFGAAR
ncbi:MAG: hypothetical protein NT062_03840 [Proteobacteria bacterium]|nr:hypothetical protein [Pseudomonadota bacterium]